MTFTIRRTKAQLKQRVKKNWGAWRLIFCDMANFTYNEVFYHMTPQQIEEANIALDIVNEQIKKQTKVRKRKH